MVEQDQGFILKPLSRTIPPQPPREKASLRLHIVYSPDLYVPLPQSDHDRLHVCSHFLDQRVAHNVAQEEPAGRHVRVQPVPQRYTVQLGKTSRGDREGVWPV